MVKVIQGYKGHLVVVVPSFISFNCFFILFKVSLCCFSRVCSSSSTSVRYRIDAFIGG